MNYQFEIKLGWNHFNLNLVLTYNINRKYPATDSFEESLFQAHMNTVSLRADDN